MTPNAAGAVDPTTVWRDDQDQHLRDAKVDHEKSTGLDGKERPREYLKRDRSKPEVPPNLRYTKVFNTVSEDVSKIA
jgi:hypothetical protein